MRSFLRRRMAGLVLLLAAFGCDGRSGGAVDWPVASPALAVAAVGAAGAGAPRVDAAVSSSGHAPQAALYVVDEAGVAIRGERLTGKAAGDEKTVRELVARTPVGAGPAVVQAAGGASLRHVSALARVLGQLGVPEIDIVTPAPGTHGAASMLKLSPLGQVPMQRDVCGARVTIKADNTAELKYLQKGRPVKLPQTPDGPDVAAALRGLRERMKGCAVTVWMLAGEGDATWGPAFHVGMAVSNAAKPPEKTRYTMLL